MQTFQLSYNKLLLLKEIINSNHMNATNASAPFITATLFVTTLLVTTLFLQGCANQPETPPLPVEPEPEKPTVAEPPPTRPFPPETLYALLVAEMAGSRERYDVALGNYIQQAHKTRDPGITARATRIARFLNAHQAALSTALLWVELEPDNTEAHLIAATELTHGGRLLEAFNHGVFLLENESASLFQNIASRAVQATDTQREQLLTLFNQQLEHRPENPQLLVGKGLLLQQQQKFDESLALVRHVLQQDDTFIPAAILEARLMYQMNMPEKALDRLVSLLQEFPENKNLRLQYARLLANYDLQKARDQFNMLVEQSPNDPELIFSLALVNNELGHQELARQYFQKLLQLNHRVSSAHYYLGRIAQSQQNSGLALEHYFKVGPGRDFLPAILQSTDLLIKEQQLNKAHKRLSELRKRFPTQSTRFYLLESEVLNKYDLLDKAEVLLTEGLNNHPNDTGLLYARAMINERRNLLPQAEQDLREILKYEPNNATTLNALGYTLADRTTRYEEALELISQALSIKPDDPAIIDSMGWVQYKLGNYEEAVLRLREAMKAYPDDEIAAHLGEVLWVTGRKKEAQKAWQEGLKINPGSRKIPATIERLDATSAETAE